MPTNLKKLTPNLMVEDVNKTLDFYRDVLGFEVLATVPETGSFDWALMKLDGVELMFQSHASLSGELSLFVDRSIAASLTFYIDVEDIESLHESVKDKVKIVQAMHTAFYGAREFAIQDSNGYVLTFAQSEQ